MLDSNLAALRAERAAWSVERASMEARCARAEEAGRRAQHDAGASTAASAPLCTR
jgi:hypothetical protein